MGWEGEGGNLENCLTSVHASMLDEMNFDCFSYLCMYCLFFKYLVNSFIYIAAPEIVLNDFKETVNVGLGDFYFIEIHAKSTMALGGYQLLSQQK